MWPILPVLRGSRALNSVLVHLPLLGTSLLLLLFGVTAVFRPTRYEHFHTLLREVRAWSREIRSGGDGHDEAAS
ncbi:hypothetical protein [Streptomyces sp. NBC_01506]|uniref:hypothetical protein n=1 Tax=Streptomyces sp. NBC_01506 TaxID=2903887 RepID=UPI003868FE4E